jgi:hypothetical protein
MITMAEQAHIDTYAYIPEHVPAYVSAISDGEPHLFKAFLCYEKKGTLIFVGYPLGEPFEEKKMKKALDRAMKEIKPDRVALVAPSAAIYREATCDGKMSDTFYKLDLSTVIISQKVRNMINRASQSLSMETGPGCGSDHVRLIAEFLETHDMSEDSRYIFDRIPAYVAASQTAIVIDARDKEGRLVAFDVAEFGSKEYAFYMFNVASRKLYVPGVSDLLLNRLLHLALERGKRFVNLGLGISKGITFFKTKWGGFPFLRYEYCRYEVKRKQTMDDLWGKL